MSKKSSGIAKFTDIKKPHVLVYRELGYVYYKIKGFDTLQQLRDFIKDNGDISIVTRLEEGK